MRKMVLSVRSVRATVFLPTASSSAFAHGLRVASVFAASARSGGGNFDQSPRTPVAISGFS